MPEKLPQNPDGDDRTAQFVRLLLANERRIHTYIMSMLTNWADADDVLQEVSIVLWRKFDEFKPGTDFGAWASRTAYYTTLNFLQKKKRNPILFSHEFIEQVAEKASTIGDDLEARHAALAECIAKLSRRDRDLINRRYQGDATTKDVAESLGRPVKAVYKSLNRIYATLFECVERRLARGNHR